MIINLKASSFNLYIFNREHLKIIHTIKPEFFQNRKVNNSCPWRTMKIAPEFLGQKTLVIVDMNMFYMISWFLGNFRSFTWFPLHVRLACPISNVALKLDELISSIAVFSSVALMHRLFGSVPSLFSSPSVTFASPANFERRDNPDTMFSNALSLFPFILPG